MRRILLLAAALLFLLPAGVRADRYRVLDAALSMLEEGNPFLVRYNEQTGAAVAARFPLGCPYFWGGRSVKRILQPASPGQASDYYRTDRTYLSGLDCVGFTRWVAEQAGYAPHGAVSELLNRSRYRETVNYRAAKTSGEARTEALDIGDLVAMRHANGGYHIAMYIGTLWDYGYTAGTLPEALAPYLYYPLLIHCAGSTDYYQRYRAWLETEGKTGIEPPYGGVIVTLLDAPPSEATGSTPDGPDGPAPCFSLEGYNLQVTDLSAERQTRWIHWRQKAE